MPAFVAAGAGRALVGAAGAAARAFSTHAKNPASCAGGSGVPGGGAAPRIGAGGGAAPALAAGCAGAPAGKAGEAGAAAPAAIAESCASVNLWTGGGVAGEVDAGG